MGSYRVGYQRTVILDRYREHSYTCVSKLNMYIFELVDTLIPHLAEETDVRLLVTHALPTGHGGGIVAALLGV
jgi:hypothetical protein